MDKLDSLGSNGLREQSTIAHALFILFKFSSLLCN